MMSINAVKRYDMKYEALGIIQNQARYFKCQKMCSECEDFETRVSGTNGAILLIFFNAA